MGLFDKFKKKPQEATFVKKGDFTYDSENQTFTIVRGGVTVTIDEADMSQENIAFASEIISAYPQKVDAICAELLKTDGFTTVFPDARADTMPQKLHEPSIRILDRHDGVMSYCNHEYDSTHIIDIEFDGVFEKFFNVSIDG